MPEKNLLEQKKNNLMKALNRQGADYVPTMLASSCAEVAWTGQKVTDVIGDANAYVKAMTDVFEVMWGDANTVWMATCTSYSSATFRPISSNRYRTNSDRMELLRNMYRCHRWSAESTIS